MDLKEKQLEQIRISEKQNQIFNNVFSTENGKELLNYITKAFLINGDLIARQYTKDDVLASHIQIGLKLAFNFINNNINKNN